MLILSQYSMESRAETNQVYLSGASSRPGQEAELTINLRNAESVIGYGCFVYLPEGVTLKSISKIQDRGGQEYFGTNETNNGGVQIYGYNYNGGSYASFTGNDGPVAKIVVSVPDNFTAGDYEVELKNISLSNASGQSLSVNETFTFKWSIIDTFTITFDSNGGTSVESITQDNGTVITPPANPTREGYTFIGWEPALPETMPIGGLAVKAQWVINKYTLTYVIDGQEYSKSEVEYNATITQLDDPVREGYTFSGWSEIPATMPAHDVEVTGSFTVNSYTLTYIVDGNAYKTLTVDYGTAITPEAEPTKEGYTFSGWSEIPATMPAHDVEVTGSFIQNIYILDENSDNADVLKQAADVAVQLKRTIKADEWSTICLPFTATGEQVKTAFGDDVQLASFTGWESEEDGNGAIVAINVMFTSVSADEGIAANTPMLIKVSETVTEATFDGVTLEPEEEPMVQVGKKASERGWFYGTYAKTIVPEENLFLSGNEFWYSTGKTAIKGFRGYFEFRDVLDAYYDDSEVKVHMLFDDDATGIETIDHSSLNIDHYYNLAGQRVGKGYKGVVIENGKKVIKK